MSDDLVLKRFPQTDVATLGGTAAGETFDRWKTHLQFDAAHTIRREHVPEHVEVEVASVRIDGDAGTYRLRFPRRWFDVQVGPEPTTVNVAEAIAVGRHTYQIEPADAGASFAATLDVAVRRPVVRVRDEGYVIDTDTVRYSHRHWLEDDRAAQRVGRYDLWLKTIGQSYDDTRVADGLSLNGPWKIGRIERTDMTDGAAVDLDDEAWEQIETPHTWDGDLAGWEGPVWYRKQITVPASWRGRTVVLRFAGVDDEPIIYVNGHHAGYSCGFHRPFQVDVGEYLDFGGENLIAICLRRRRGVGFDKGMAYGFIRDDSLITYPDRDELVGGIYGDCEIAAVEHLGSIMFEPRVHPQFEGALRVRFARIAGETVHPLVAGDASELVYRPPTLVYRNLSAGDDIAAALAAIVGYDRDLIRFDGRLSPAGGGSDATIEIVVEIYPAKFGEAVDIEVVDGGVRIVGAESGKAMLVAAPDDPASTASVHMDDAGIGFAQRHVVRLQAAASPDGRFSFALGAGDDVEADLAWLGSVDNPADALAEPWEREVYNCAVPVQRTEQLAASLRTCKQVLTLNSRLIEGEPSGLTTDPIKYPVFWLRDAAISIPGSLYAGTLARRAAIVTAGEVYDQARQQVDNTILRPDGTMRPGQQSSDNSQLAVYAIYKSWCLMGDDWLRRFYPTVVTYLQYADEVQRRFDNADDGIIRASDGDWFDFARPGKYEREGASVFVNVMYLRALKVGVQMARAMADTANADRWAATYESGCSLLTRPVAEGGLYLSEEGYLADTIQTISDDHPNGWNYPRDLQKVTVLSGFRPMPHCVAIAEGIITDPALIDAIVEKVDTYNIIRPFPAAVRYPWSDYMTSEGLSGEYEQTEYGIYWKCLPGCHAAGGRWAFAGGFVQLGLWRAGAETLAREAKANQAGYLTLAHQPARVFEDAHYSGLFRNQAGDPKDAEGFYYTWGAATPLQAMVEGEYGVEPVPGGVRIDPAHCRIDDGILNVPIAGGVVSYRRTGDQEYRIEIRSDVAGRLVFIAPDPAWAAAAEVESSGGADVAAVSDREIVIAYDLGESGMTIRT